MRFRFIHSIVVSGSIVWFIISCIVGMGDRGIVSSSGGSLVGSSGGRSVRIGVGVGSSGGDELVACGGVEIEPLWCTCENVVQESIRV